MSNIQLLIITANDNGNEEMRKKWIRSLINNNRQIIENGLLWNIIARENIFLTNHVGTQGFLQQNHATVSKVYMSFSFKDIVGKIFKRKKGDASTCEPKKKKKKVKKPRCPKKKAKKKCSKTKKTCLDPSKKKKQEKEDAKEDPCKGEIEKKADPCAMKGDSDKKKEDPCKDVKAKKADPCAKKGDSGKKKDDPCKDMKAKKADPCAKKGDSGKKKDDPCKDMKAKKADPCAKKGDSGKKKDDPCKDMKAKKADPCAKKGDSGKKKDDPCKDMKAKKADPCAKKGDSGKKKDDPCKDMKAKKADPCAKKGDSGKKKDDPCKDMKAKKADPCAKKGDSGKKKDDPCKDMKAKKADPCAKKGDSGKKKDDPCKDMKAKKADPCAKKGDSSKKKDDPCKDMKAKKADPCAKKGDSGKKKDDPCKDIKAKKADPCAKKGDSGKKKADPCAKKEDPCAMKSGSAKKIDDPCKELKEKIAKSRKKKGEKKDDPCKDMKAKKADPCAKKGDSGKKKADPCAKKEDPCAMKSGSAKKIDDPCKELKEKIAKSRKKNDDPCKDKKSKKSDPCAMKEDPCAKKAGSGKKKDDPCKDLKAKKDDPCAKKDDPCAMKSGSAKKKDDPCKELKEKIAKSRKKKGEKKDDPCKELKAKIAESRKKKVDSFGKKTDSSKKKDPCAKIIKGTIIDSFMSDNRSVNTLRKQYPITTLLTVNSAKSRRLVPSYSKLTVRGLKQLNRHSKIIYRNEGKKRKVLSKTIMKGNVVPAKTGKTTANKGPVSVSAPGSILNLMHRAKEGLTNCIVHIAHYKKNIAADTFNLGRRLDSLRSLIGCDYDQDITRDKYEKTLKMENKITKRVLLSFGVHQQNKVNNYSDILEQLPKPIEHKDVYLLLCPTTLQTICKYFCVDKEGNRNDLRSEVAHFKHKSSRGINNNALSVTNLYSKQISNFMTGFESNSQKLKKLFKWKFYFGGFLDGTDTLNCINFKDTKVSKTTPSVHFGVQSPEGKKWNANNHYHKTNECHKRYLKINESIPNSKCLSSLDVRDKSCYIPEIDISEKKSSKECKISPCCEINYQSGNNNKSNNLNKIFLKMSLTGGENRPADCNNWELESSKNGICNGFMEHKELKCNDNFIKFNEKCRNNQFVDISNLDSASGVDIIFEKPENHVYCCNSLGLLVYWMPNTNNRCIQMDIQQLNRSSDAEVHAINLLDPSINSNGIQYFIDLEKCNRRREGKKRRRVPICYDPDVESPIDNLYNQGENYWPFYNDCHKRIKDPNTYPPGSDPNANHMLFDHLEVLMNT